MAETKIERISCSQIGEQYTHIQHKSGLSIYVSEMEGFSTCLLYTSDAADE